jgi:hypothetical protein
MGINGSRIRREEKKGEENLGRKREIRKISTAIQLPSTVIQLLS